MASNSGVDTDWQMAAKMKEILENHCGAHLNFNSAWSLMMVILGTVL
jgi:hypothetical protein